MAVDGSPLIALYVSDNLRSQVLGKACLAGARRTRFRVSTKGPNDLDVRETFGVLYGYKELSRVYDRYVETGTPFVFLDLPYWQRGRGVYDPNSYHKMSVGGRHPAPEHLNKASGRELRFSRFRVPVSAPRRASGNRKVLVCGMSAKAASVYGFEPHEWETRACQRVLDEGWTPIYRPKPTWIDWKPIGKLETSRPNESLEKAFSRVDFVYSHHSNCGVDALLAGIPQYTEIGPLVKMQLPAFSTALQTRWLPDAEDRRVFAEELSWFQWSLREMTLGTPFLAYREMGFL